MYSKVRTLSFVSIVLLFALTISCSEDEPGGVIACIEDVSAGTFGEPTQFASCSENAATLLWTFPDGSTSTDANPSFTLQQLVNNRVELVATDAQGNSNQTSIVVSFSEGGIGKLLEVTEGTAGVKPVSLTDNGSDFWILSDIVEAAGNNFTVTRLNASYDVLEEFTSITTVSGLGNFPRRIANAADGGSYVLYFNHTASGDTYKVIKLSSTGQMDWTHTSSLEPAVFTEDQSGNLVIFGTQNEKIYKVTVSAAGATTDELELAVAGSGFKVRGAVPTADGFAVVGDLDEAGERDILVFETATDGNILWSTTIGDGNGADDLGSAIDYTGAGVVITGSLTGEAAYAHIHNSGAVMGQVELGEERGLDILYTNGDQIYLSAGGSNGLGKFATIMKLNLDGSIAWTRALSSQENSAVISIVESQNGIIALLAVSQTDAGITTSKVKLVNISADGVVLN